MTRARITRVGQSEANSEAFMRFVMETYADDFNGYRADILGMRSDIEWQNRVGSKLMTSRRVAVQSGHGIGKTGFCAAAIHWFLATRPKPAVVATANTEVQLQTKLWRELAKVNQQAVNKDWFDWQATKFSLAASPTAFAVAIPWNENNPEAFAGTHEEHVLGIFDEASGIPDIIWSTFSGAMTTKGAKWLATGNPTVNTGRFYEMCNGSMRYEQEGDELDGKWHAFTIGSAESPLVTDEWIREQKATLREDEFRVRVLGLPPLEAPDQFISPTLVDEATRRQNVIFERWPLVIGVDVARQGSDRSVIVARRGKVVLDNIKSFHNLSLKQLAWKVAEEIRRYRDEGLEVSAVFIEGGGSIGWGVIEELWELGYAQVREVNPGATALEPERFANMRNQMWGYLKEWLEEGGQLPRNGDLRSDLIIPKRKPDPSMKLRLESKDEMRRRAGRSPDFGDALALTFAAPVELLPEKRRDTYSDYETMEGSSGDWMTL